MIFAVSRKPSPSAPSPSRARWVLSFLLLAAPLGLLPGVATAGPGPSRTVGSSGSLSVGSPAPTFAGWDTNEKMVTLRTLFPPQGQATQGPVVLSFFATWCEPCERGLPILARVQEKMREKNLRVVLVAFGQRSQDFKGWLAERKIDLTAVADPFAKIAERFGVDQSLPRTFVLDAEGRLRTIFVTEGSDFEEALEVAVRSALAGTEAAPAVTKEAEGKDAG